MDRDFELEFGVFARGKKIRKNNGNGLFKGIVELNEFAVEKGMVDKDRLLDALIGPPKKKVKVKGRRR